MDNGYKVFVLNIVNAKVHSASTDESHSQV